MTASLLTEVCHGVSTEPRLQPLSGEAMLHGSANVEDGARLDVAVHGFWGGRFEKAFLGLLTIVGSPPGVSFCSSRGHQLPSLLDTVAIFPSLPHTQVTECGIRMANKV